MTAIVLRRAFAPDAGIPRLIHLDAQRAAGSHLVPAGHDDREVEPHLPLEELPTAEAWIAERDGEPLGIPVLADGWLDQLSEAPVAERTGWRRRSSNTPAAGGRADSCSGSSSRNPARSFSARHAFVPLAGSDGTANEEGAPDLLPAWPGPRRALRTLRVAAELSPGGVREGEDPLRSVRRR